MRSPASPRNQAPVLKALREGSRGHRTGRKRKKIISTAAMELGPDAGYDHLSTGRALVTREKTSTEKKKKKEGDKKRGHLRVKSRNIRNRLILPRATNMTRREICIGDTELKSTREQKVR